MPNSIVNKRMISAGAYGGNTDLPRPIGNIFTDNFARAAIGPNYTNTGAFSCDGTRLVATFPGGGLFDSRLEYTAGSYSTNLEDWNQQGLFNVGALDGFGLAIGVGPTSGIAALLFLNTFPGRIRLFDNGGGVIATSNPLNDIALNNNDYVFFSITNTKGTLDILFRNITTPGEVSLQYVYSLTYPVTTSQPINFKPTLYSVGGTQYVYNWSYGSTALLGAQRFFIGDSITAGFFANSESNRWSVLASDGYTYTIYAGPGLRTGQFNNTEMATLVNPNTIVLICLGTNDQLIGEIIATSVNNLTTMKNALEASGATVYFCQIPPLDTVDVTAYNAALVAAFGSAVRVDFFTLLKGAGTAYAVGKSPDGIHPANTEMSDMGATAALGIA